MTSFAKIRANRANARASTGAKTAHGRAKAAKNALRHALNVPISDPVLSAEIDALAREIAGANAEPEFQQLARQIAEAEIGFRRVRQARHQLLAKALSDPYYEPRADTRMKVRSLCDLLRPDAAEMPLPNILIKSVITTPQGPLKLVTILSEEFKRLLAIDRYERRACSRRKFAIRAFDRARHKRMTDNALIPASIVSSLAELR